MIEIAIKKRPFETNLKSNALRKNERKKGERNIKKFKSHEE